MFLIHSALVLLENEINSTILLTIWYVEGIVFVLFLINHNMEGLICFVYILG